MAKKTDIKICRYAKCNHPNKEINITCDAFEEKGTCYYHADCYAAKSEAEEAEKKIKADMQLIKTMWIENISNTVVYSQLFRCLNDLLDQGIESSYLVFVMQYCVTNKLNLRYPMGFKYFVDKAEIKNAYKKKNLLQHRVSQSDFSANDTDDAPKFSINKKPVGFKRILGGDK